ncbi:hypothetical protein BC830DRAFT_1087664 [Chytriomyces sp. MP71]|nr:hypothetical protein BC830DRAFT_1087664 [Chytriomyces sp. MP71]
MEGDSIETHILKPETAKCTVHHGVTIIHILCVDFGNVKSRLGVQVCDRQFESHVVISFEPGEMAGTVSPATNVIILRFITENSVGAEVTVGELFARLGGCHICGVESQNSQERQWIPGMMGKQLTQGTGDITATKKFHASTAGFPVVLYVVQHSCASLLCDAKPKKLDRLGLGAQGR